MACFFLDKESSRRQRYLKAYLIYGNSSGYRKQYREVELEKIGTELGLRTMALTFVPSFSDRETGIILNKVNPLVENTFIVYKNRSIINKYINLKPTANNFAMLTSVLDKTKGEYFGLEEPAYH